MLCGIFMSCQQQSKYSQDAQQNEISSSNLKKHTYALASDQFEGRGAGYKGERLAAEYIAAVYESIGLEPVTQEKSGLAAYFQDFDFHTLNPALPWSILNTQNVIGILKSELNPDEYIVVGGHHDGQGMLGQIDLGRDVGEIVTDSLAASKDSIWNSAVDNAISISAILEIARFLKSSEIQINRSIIFTTFSAEESGLNGSTHFVSNPPVPIGQIKAMINLEQIVGDPDADFLYVSYGTNSIFEKIRMRIDSSQRMNLTPFYPGMLANTDHYAFAHRDIPAITIGTGSSINIHTPLDHPDRLDYDLATARTQYILQYLIELANAKSTFEFEGDLSVLTGVSGGNATKAELRSIGFDGNVAFKITAVVKGSKGYQAGLRSGDIVIAANNKPIVEQKFYQGLEDAMGNVDLDMVSLLVGRGKERIKVIFDP